MSEHLQIDPGAGIPIYRQIANQMRCRVTLGLLKPQQPLPSIQSVAVQIGVSPNTVVKAYEALAAQGLVERRRGLGTFVSGAGTQEVDRTWRIIETRIDALFAEAQELSLTPEALLELMHRRQVMMRPD